MRLERFFSSSPSLLYSLLASLTYFIFIFMFFTDTFANYSNRPLFAVTHSFFSVPTKPLSFLLRNTHYAPNLHHPPWTLLSIKTVRWVHIVAPINSVSNIQRSQSLRIIEYRDAILICLSQWNETYRFEQMPRGRF